jgi:hypothetical protein
MTTGSLPARRKDAVAESVPAAAIEDGGAATAGSDSNWATVVVAATSRH